MPAAGGEIVPGDRARKVMTFFQLSSMADYLFVCLFIDYAGSLCFEKEMLMRFPGTKLPGSA